jgi:predicted nucleic acid-binding protein
VASFFENARSNGLLIDTNLLVLLIIGAVNRDRIPRFKRTSNYRPEDWDILRELLGQIPGRIVIPHILAEVSTLTDMKGSDLFQARRILRLTVEEKMEEVPIPSEDAFGSAYYDRLGLTDAAVCVTAKRLGCSVITNDFQLYSTLLNEGASAELFSNLQALL